MNWSIEHLRDINRNENGDYYFIFDVPKVTNHIRPGAKPRDEVLIVGVPQNKLKTFLGNMLKEKNQ